MVVYKYNIIIIIYLDCSEHYFKASALFFLYSILLLSATFIYFEKEEKF